jgi:hypothetical protein
MVGHRGKPLFMRLYSMSLAPACEVYLGNMDLFVLNFWIALEGAWFSVVEDVVFRNIFEKLAQKPPALNRTTFK